MKTLTLIHVAISLIAIVAGFPVVRGFLQAKPVEGWTKIFLVMTVLTSLTGFLFPFRGLTPALVFGILSLAVLALAIYARYSRKLTGSWRPIFVLSSLLAFYLNFFVLVVQSFQKIPALNALAPTQQEAPFQLTQGLFFLAFAVVGFLATVRSKTQPIAIS